VVAFAVVTAWIGSSSAWADSVKLGDIWLNNVTVSEFKDGEVVLVNEAGEVRRPLKDVRGFRAERHPMLEEAEIAYAAKDYKKALGHFITVRSRVQPTEAWLRQWVLYRSLRCQEELGEGFEAMQTFIALFEAKVEPFFMQRVPEQSLSNLNAKQKTLLIERLDGLLKRVRKGSPDYATFERLRKAVVEATPKEPGTPTPNDSDPSPTKNPGNPGTLTKPTPTANARGASAIAMSRALDTESENDPMVGMLRKGKFTEAHDAARAALAKKDIPSPSRTLYALGLAQLGLAEAETDAAKKDLLYRDAGLSFMRVVIYFPSATDFVGASLLEAAYVHAKLDRKQQAIELLNQSDTYLDPDEEPELAKRRADLAKVLNP
jgi:tetratricopeptide (TPR) repeat protein